VNIFNLFLGGFGIKKILLEKSIVSILDPFSFFFFDTHRFRSDGTHIREILE